MDAYKKVTFKAKPTAFVFGGIYPEQRTSVVLNKEGADHHNPLYPVYDNETINQVLKVRSKIYFAEGMELLKQKTITQDGITYICWYSSKNDPMLVPPAMTEFVKNMGDGDYGLPIVFESQAVAVALQPINVWMMVPATTPENFVNSALAELTRWVRTSERWWGQKPNDSVKENTRLAILKANKV